MSEKNWLWGGMLCCVFIIAFFLGRWVGANNERYYAKGCPPPPEIRICRGWIPERQLNGIDAPRDGT